MDEIEQNAETPADTGKSASGIVSRVRNYFLTGLVVAGPVAVTAWLIWWFVTWVDNVVRPVIPLAYRPETYLPVNIPGLGLIIAFVALTLLGFLTANLVGSRLVSFGESLLSRMPIVRPIYRTTKQIFQTLFSSSEFELSECGSGRVSGAGDVVAGIFELSHRVPKFPRTCRRASMCRRSCRARQTRPPGSSSTCRGAT